MGYLGNAFPAPRPEEGSLQHEFLSAAHDRRLTVQRCGDCGGTQFPPEVICRRCQSENLHWADIAPRGNVYSWTRVWHPSSPAAAEHVPYIIAVIDVGLSGVRFVGNMLGDPLREIEFGAPVVAVFEDVPGQSLALVQWETK